MWAGSLAHNGLTQCGASSGGDWTSHILEHEIGGMFDVTHGAGLAAIWPAWARYVCGSCVDRFAKFAINVMGVDPTDKKAEEIAEEGIQAMEAFYRSIGMPTNMKELGIEPTAEQIAAMAAGAAKACGGSRGTAKLLHEAATTEIYTDAR